MTKEELARFALVLREAERVRAQIAEDATSAQGHGDDLRPPSAAPEHSFGPVMAAA
jgi:hypothetical protein